MLTNRKWVYEFAVLFTTVISISGICEFKFLHEENKTDDGAALFRINYPVKPAAMCERGNVLYVWPVEKMHCAADSIFGFRQPDKVILLLHPDSLIFLNTEKNNPIRNLTGAKLNAKQPVFATDK